MLAFSAPAPLTWQAAVGERVLAEFGAAARLHADGWGTARRSEAGGRGVVTASVDPDAYDDAAARTLRLAAPARAGLLYLRFASRGAAVSHENVQPFLLSGVAFQHNGALVPRERIVAGLTDAERDALRGTTDSEVYFARALRHGIHHHPVRAVATAAREVRALFPEACLNAFVLHPLGLFVVHSPGTAALPIESFARRGFSAADLPVGHDERYNVLSRTVTSTGATVVATTGVDQRGWEPLPADTVNAIAPAGAIRTIAL
jgi:predicted glutamine amidotransferase